MKLYPLKLTPVLKNAVWGGKKISERFGIGEIGKSCAEAWMLTLRPDGVNLIENGPAIGMTLEEYRSSAGAQALYGKDDGCFPLLIKIIDASDRLSVQVHPDDVYAASHGLDAGKTEMWYVLEAEPGATLVNGLKPGVTPEEIKDAARIGACEPLLNSVKVKKGDCFYIPAGLVHAIGKGILIAEIQQNSNTTYRLYDYDRVGTDGKKRELHTDKAAEVIKTAFDLTGVTVNKTLSDKDGVTEKILCSSPFFSAKSLTVGYEKTAILPGGKMLHILCVRGEGQLVYNDCRYRIGKGDSYLIPAALGGGKMIASAETELILSQGE